MVLPYLSILAAVAVVVAAAILFYEIKKEGYREFTKYLVAGFVVAFVDFLIEFLGTSTNNWAYNQSLFMLFEIIPLELALFFFSGGVVARFVYKWGEEIPKPMKLNTLLYMLILLGTLAYVREAYLLKLDSNILYIAVPLGFWGILNIKEEGNRISALVLATCVAFIDAIVETFLLRSGTYVYATGDFPWQIPLVYALFALGLFGFLERIEVLDKVFDHAIVRGWLQVLGIRRELYKRRVERAVRSAKRKLNGIRD